MQGIKFIGTDLEEAQTLTKQKDEISQLKR